MFTSHTIRRYMYHGVLESALAGLIYSWSGLVAASPATVPAEVQFVSPVTITTGNSQPSGDDQLASLDLGTSMTRAMTITVNIRTSSTVYTVDDFQCSYNNGAITGACDGAGPGVTASADNLTLQIGAKLIGNGLDVADATNSNIDVIVSYQ